MFTCNFFIYNFSMARDESEILPVSRSEFSELAIFKHVAFESVAGYLLGCQVIVIEPGEIVIDKSKTKRNLLIVLSGQLEVQLEAQGGFYTSLLGPGQCAGEMSIFDNQQPSADVYAKERSRLLVITPDRALAMINASHDLCLNFLNMLSQRIRNSNKAVCEENFHIRCIEEHAVVDSLTGLHNRRWLEEMFARELLRCHSGNICLAAFMIDVDYFKDVNDTYGHLAGDQVLTVVANTINHTLRPSDMPVRYGGEEFAVFLPDTTSENARMIAERLRKTIESTQIVLSTGNVLNVTVSIGYTERFEDDTVDSIIDRADQALYHAKQNGRNRLCLNLGDDALFLF